MSKVQMANLIWMDEEGTEKRMKLVEKILKNEFYDIYEGITTITPFSHDEFFADGRYGIGETEDKNKHFLVRARSDHKPSIPLQEVIDRAKKYDVIANSFVNFNDIFCIMHEIGHEITNIPFEEYMEDIRKLEEKYKDDEEGLVRAYRTEILDEKLADEQATKFVNNKELMSRINNYIVEVERGL